MLSARQAEPNRYDRDEVRRQLSRERRAINGLRIVAARAERLPRAVVSAMGKTTDRCGCRPVCRLRNLAEALKQLEISRGPPPETKR